VTSLYPQTLALTLPTGGGRSVGIVRSRTKATVFSLVGENKKDFDIIKMHGTTMKKKKGRDLFKFCINLMADISKSSNSYQVFVQCL
jgi:hypothetical protein